MNTEKLAKDIIVLAGGRENIISLAHCATRLRMIIKDETKFNKDAIDALDGVKGVFKNSGQMQIIIGQGTVNTVYDEMVKAGDFKETGAEEQKQEAVRNLNFFQRFARLLSNIFVPIIPVIVASGVLMGVLNLLSSFNLVDSSSGIYMFLDMFSNAAFTFLPVIIGFSAAKQFGCNPYLAAVLGGIMIHPSLLNAWNMGTASSTVEYFNLFGLNIEKVGYQGTVLPILLAVFFMAYVEKFIRKIIPDVLDILLTPFFTLLITGFATFIIIGPVGRIIGDGIAFLLVFLYEKLALFAGVIFGGLYSLIVITGMHHSFHAVEATLIASAGANFLLPIWSMANVAQGGACLGAYIRSHDKKLKSVALPASVSCLLGITEAAIFGVNLRLVRPFAAAMIGGAIGGGFVVLMKVSMTGIGVTGIPGIAICGTLNNMLFYIIGMVLAFFSSFLLSLAFGAKKK